MVYIGYSMLLFEVLQLLCENKIDFVLKRYADKLATAYKKKHPQPDIDFFNDNSKIALAVLQEIVEEIDSSEMYLEWIAKQFILGLFDLYEDASQIKEDLEEFEKYKRKMQYQDINRYNLRTLRQELKKFDTSGNEGDFGAELQKAIENNDIKLVERCNGFVIYHALTKEGNILLGKGGGHKFNKWCTARTDDKNKFEYYNTELNSNIYVAIFENGKRFQFDIDRVEHLVQNCMDELDDDMLGGESSDSEYWLIIRKSDLVQSEYRKSMERHWAFNSTMTTWEQFVKDSIKHNKRIMPSLSIILQSISNEEEYRYDIDTLISDFAAEVMRLSDSNFLDDLETLGVFYRRNNIDSLTDIVDKEIIANRRITNRVASIFKSGDEYIVDEYNSFVVHLYAIGNGHHVFKGVK